MPLKKTLAFALAFIMMFSCFGVISYAFAEDEISISNVAFYMINDEEIRRIDTLTDVEKLRTSVKIKNTSDYPKDITVYLAYYCESGVLETIDLCKKTLYAGCEDEFEANVTISNVTHASYAKVFIWGEKQKPFSVSKTIKGTKVQKRIYVSPDGKDENSGTIDSPFATIERARDEVRKYNDNMTGDIYVYLREGMYRQNSTLSFTHEDSATNGYRINYTSYPGERAKVTGSRDVSSWVPAEGNIWSATVTDISDVSQLYVDGTRAKRASGEVQYRVLDVFDDTADSVKDGIVVSGDAFSKYNQKEDIQLHFARGWRSFLLNVDRIELENGNSKFYLSQPGFSNVYKKSQYYTIENGHTFYLENAMEELDTPGEFYYNRGNSTLYYIPHNNQDMQTASCEIATLDTLIDIRGEGADNKARNISFSSIEFAHSSWSRAINHGHVGDQAQDMAWDTSEDIRNPGYTMVPSNISITRAEGIVFKDNVIRDMGAVAIGMHNGATDCKIVGNTFCDLGDSAVTVGMPDMAYEDGVYAGRNLAADKWVSASGSTGNYTPEKAIDSNTRTGWSSNETGSSWWQVDLGSAYEIDRVDILDRQDIASDSQSAKAFRDIIRKNIIIYGSNDKSFENHTVLYRSEESIPDNQAAVYNITDAGKYRYVRISKAGYMFLSDVRIINESMAYSPMSEICTSNLISNNYITRAGLTNYGASGIQTYFTKETEISNNYLYDLPYSGICVGWGWTNYSDSTVCRENKILNNRIEKTSRINFDGGAIYTLGQQPESIISGNYVVDALHVNGGIYLDNGTRHYTVENNVVEDAPMPFVASAYTYNNIWKNNFSSVKVYENALHTDSTSSFEEPEYFIPENYPNAAQRVIDNAGLEHGYHNNIANADDNIWLITDEAIWGNVINDANNEHYTYEQFRRGYFERFIESADEWVSIAADYDCYSVDDISALKEACDDAREFVEADKITPTDRETILKKRAALRNAMDRFVSAKRGIYDSLPAKTVELNVAQYKPVTIKDSGSVASEYPLSNVTDGNRYTFTDFTYSNCITVDLMRRYNVKRIELYSRHNYEYKNWCSNFKVYGSNTEDFTDKIELKNYGEYNKSLFPVKGSYIFDVDIPDAIRYIRIEYPVGTTWLSYGDIRVFADVDVTEVTNKNMTVHTAPVSTTYPGVHLIDGDNYTFVYPGYNKGYPFFTVDLGRAYPIGMIEMDSRISGDDGYLVHYGISLYGSNDMMSNEDNVNKSSLTAEDGYTRLAWIGNTFSLADYINNPDMQFKRHAITGVYPSYRESFPNGSSYRYITVKDDEQQSLQASELRAYVLNPMVTGTAVDDKTVKVSFSDPMKEEYMTSENIVLKNDGKILQIREISLSDDGYELSIDSNLESDCEYTLEISNKVRNRQDVTMQKSKTITLIQ